MLLVVGCYLLSGAALAQVTTANEEQRRRGQQEAEERLLRQQAPDVRLQAPVAVVDATSLDLPPETPCFPIERIKSSLTPFVLWNTAAVPNIAQISVNYRAALQTHNGHMDVPHSRWL